MQTDSLGTRAVAWIFSRAGQLRLVLSPMVLVMLLMPVGGCGIFDGEEIDTTKGWSANQLYADAKDEMAHSNYEAAIKMFEKLEARYPFGRYAQQAQIEIAYAYYKSGEQAQALAAADRFIKLHPNHPAIDYVIYLKGLINFNEKLGMFSWLADQDVTERDSKAARDAFDTFKELVTRFPDSKYAPDATDRMRYLVNALASSDVHIARFYYRRGAYLAAINRSQYVVAQFPQTPAVEEALFLMVKSYDALGMNDLRDDADRVMRTNFPQSYYLTGKKPKKDEPWWKLW